MYQYKIKIEGMKCSMCEAHVNDIIRKRLNPKKVTSSHTKGETTVLINEKVDFKAVKDAIEKDGYHVLDIKEQEYKKRGFFHFK